MAAIIIALIFLVSSTVAEPLKQDDSDNSRIIGGSDAPDGRYPYQVSIRLPQNIHNCGGSIISPVWILTAAHCAYRIPPSSMTVVVGTNLLNVGGTGYEVLQVICHEYYNADDNYRNDIAVLRLASSIRYNDKVRPVALASSGTPPGASCVVSGWGSISWPNEFKPNRLQHVGLTSITNTQCQNSLPPRYRVYDTNLCTFQGHGQGVCLGDSGGTLECYGEQHGIVSWVIPCAVGRPDVYTSVAAYRSWIRSKTGI